MDITQFVINDHTTDKPGVITFQGKDYQPSELAEFADALTQLVDEAESYLPEEETQEYKERQAFMERQAYEMHKRFYEETTIRQYQSVWDQQRSAGGHSAQDDDMWRAQDGDYRTRIIASLRKYEADHGITA